MRFRESRVGGVKLFLAEDDGEVSVFFARLSRVLKSVSRISDEKRSFARRAGC